jgi:3-oxoacyl-[acyl-carrier-protein] synthase-1
MGTYIAGDNIITSLGFTTAANFDKISSGATGVKIVHENDLYPEKFPASLVDKSLLNSEANEKGIDKAYTRFEQLIILSVSDAVSGLNIDLTSPKTLLIISTTKGNIDLLKDNKGFQDDRVHLWKSAQEIGHYFDTARPPLVVSNACVSGVLAIIAAHRMIAQGKYENIVVCGCDVLSEFIVSGFQSFFSLSKDVCKPFDKNRSGLSLGEGAGTIVLTSNKSICPKPLIEVVSGSGSNDANHISGPSRTGEGLYIAIDEVLNGRSDIDFISAHGTATAYNDDMESIAFSRCNLGHVPVNSYKGYIGHTLGAAGVIESIFCFETMRKNLLVKTYGFENLGTAENLNVIGRNISKPIVHVVKTASGFGGSNAVVLFKKEDDE